MGHEITTAATFLATCVMMFTLLPTFLCFADITRLEHNLCFWLVKESVSLETTALHNKIKILT